MQSHPKAILRAPDATAFTGDRRSTFYSKIARGLLPPGVSLGGQIKGWPLHELEAVNSARIGGATEEEVAALVRRLVEGRKQQAVA